MTHPIALTQSRHTTNALLSASACMVLVACLLANSSSLCAQTITGATMNLTTNGYSSGTQTYLASDSITATSFIINAGNSVAFGAINKITLLPGFQATAGSSSTFQAYIIHAPLSLTTTSLPSGVPGVTYSTTVSATGGTAPYTWSAGGLPAGLSININTGQISGTPTTNGTSSVTITVTDASSPTATVSAVLALIVAPVGSATRTAPVNLALGQATTPTLTWTAATNATAYNVCLSTQGQQQQCQSVTTTSYTPAAALSAGTEYFWTVQGTQGTLLGPTSSSWAFWTTGAPSVVSVSPSSTSAPVASQTFAFTFRSPKGRDDINWTEILFNYYNIGAQACFVGFWPGNNQIGLFNDDPTQGYMWLGTVGQPTSEPPNSQCSVDVTNSSVSHSDADPTIVILNLKLTFLPGVKDGKGLPGPQQIRALVGDNDGLDSAWQSIGSWVTSSVTPGGLSTVSITPPSASFSGFSYQASSVNGWAYITEFDAAFSAPNQSGPSSPMCYVNYNRLSGQLTLLGLNGWWSTTPAQTATLGLAGQTPISNDFCTLDASNSSAAPTDPQGNTFQLNLAVTLNQAPGTALDAFLYVYDRYADVNNLNAMSNGNGWLTQSYTVPNGAPPPPVSTSVVCNSPTQATVSWTLPTGQSSANVRVNYNTTTCSYPSNVIATVNDSNGSTSGSYTFPVTSGQQNCYWVETHNAAYNQNYSSGVGFTSFSCGGSTMNITTGSLPNGVAGVAYSAAVSASGGVSPYTWSATGLPSGMAISTAGTISGTPTVTATVPVILTVNDSTSPTHLTASTTLSLSVSSPPVITTTSLPNGTMGIAYSATLAATGGNGAYHWSATTALPPGLTLDAVTGKISGAPTSTGTSSITFKVTDSTSPTAATATASLSITVSSTLSVSSIVSSVTAVTSGGTTSVQLTVSLTGAAPSNGVSVSLASNAGAFSVPATLSVPGGTSTATITVTPGIVSSLTTARISATYNGTTSAQVTIYPPLTFSTITLPTAPQGAPYLQAVSISGGTGQTSWQSPSGLPAGISFTTNLPGNANQPGLSGTPTASPGTYTVTFVVTDTGGGSATLTLPLNVTLQPVIMSGAVSGSPNSQITITGVNFGTSQPTVIFPTSSGTQSVIASSYTSTQLTVTVPSTAVQGNIQVETADGYSNSEPFTPVAPPAPAISSLSMTQGPLLMGFDINGSNFGSSQGSVTMGGIALTLVAGSWSPTKVTVQLVPTDPSKTLVSGNVVLTTTDNQSSNPVSFQVKNPFGCNF